MEPPAMPLRRKMNGKTMGLPLDISEGKPRISKPPVYSCGDSQKSQNSDMSLYKWCPPQISKAEVY